jgi:hypothetical protein
VISHPSIELLGLEGPGFFSDVGAFLTIVAPFSIWFLLWRMFVTNRSGPRGDVTILGLSESLQYFVCECVHVPAHVRLSYCLVSVVTFVVGFLSSEGLKFLQQIFLSKFP